jgi:hypothetical protein
VLNKFELRLYLNYFLKAMQLLELFAFLLILILQFRDLLIHKDQHCDQHYNNQCEYICFFS